MVKIKKERALEVLKPKDRSSLSADVQSRYPDIHMVSPGVTPSSFKPEELYILWQNEEIPEGIVSLKDAIRSPSKFGEHTRQLIAMGHSDKVKLAFQETLKKSLLFKLREHMFVVDHFIPLETQLKEDPKRWAIMNKLHEMGLSTTDMKNYLVKPIASLPSLKVSKQGERVEIVAVTMEMSGGQHIAVKKNGKYYSIMMDNYGVRSLFPAIEQYYEENNKKADVVLYPSEYSNSYIDGFNFVDPETGEEMIPNPEEDSPIEVTKEEYDALIQKEAKALNVPPNKVILMGYVIKKPKDSKPTKQKRLGV